MRVSILFVFVISCLTNLTYEYDAGLHLLNLYVDDGGIGSGERQLPTDTRRGKRAVGKSHPPDLISYRVTSKVTARFVSTSAVAELVNNADSTQQAGFTFQMSQDAFINGFSMTVDGVTYVAQIKERQAAKDAYDDAVSRGQNAAHVSQEPSLSARFRVDLNLRDGITAVFNLTYQEMLRREGGRLTHNLYLTPGQVTHLRADVNIIEPQGLSLVEAAWTPSEDGLFPTLTFDPPSTRASVIFEPSKSDQSEVSSDGLEGILSVIYDVIHSLDGGDLQISNGYFVHHISPEGLPTAPRKIVFLIDISASMYGPKMAQTVAAIVAILEELREIDKFNILTFSNEVDYWRDTAVPSTRGNKKAAQKFLTCIRAQRTTNLQRGLLAALDQFNVTNNAFPAIVLISDGRPNSGITDPNVIISSVSRTSGGRVALFAIGIGPDVDDALLQTLASSNQGLYRKVTVDSSAAIQISGFFHEVMTPLLYDVAIRYQNGSVDETSLTENRFMSYLEGSELVVSGRVADEFRADSMGAVVQGKGLDEEVELNVTTPVKEVISSDMVQDFVERMWAYLTIQSILARARRDKLLTDDPPDASDLNAKALELSLRYSFVTPLASILVLSPPEVLPTERVPPSTTDRLLVKPHQITPAPTQAEPKSKEDIQGTSAAHVPPPISLASGDPHFIVQVPHTNLTICFDVQAKNGTIFNLVGDPIRGIYVNAEVVPVNRTLHGETDHNHPSSLIGSLGVQLGYYRLHITPDRVLVDSEIVMEWGIPRSVIIGDYNITVQDKSNMNISIDNLIELHIKRHYQWPNHPDHFDFSLRTNDGFSRTVHGLLGQFQYKPMHLTNPHQGTSADGHTRALMDISGRERFVFKKKESIDVDYECWWAPPEVYLDGAVEQYFMRDLYSRVRGFEQTGNV